ncbi:Uncharacterised protein [Chlamydia trachomatis]|nr:Uncharacterised protein [Chlamydia trachomatis]
MDDVERIEFAYGLAHGGARNTEVRAELGLGGQRVPGLKLVGKDVALNRIHRHRGAVY